MLGAIGIAVLASAAPAAAAPVVPAGFKATKIAVAPAGAKLPDDIAELDGRLFVAYQNGVPSKGPAGSGPANSTLVAYTATGKVLHSWSLRGKIDGLAADTRNRRLIITADEDGNSVMYVGSGKAIVPYTYSPDPGKSATGGVHTGGGTDAVSVLPDGTIIATASAPGPLSATAAFKVTLSTGSKHIATLKPTFADDAIATSALTRKPVTLGLTDPDSNAIVAGSSPRFGGQFVIDSQGDQQLVFVKNIQRAGPFGAARLTQLPLSHGGTAAGVDDVRWAAGRGGSLFAVDEKAGAGAIYRIKGPFHAGQAFASLDTVGNKATTTEVDTIDLKTGALKPFATGLAQSKGLLWVAG
jgi:hypothetical protein